MSGTDRRQQVLRIAAEEFADSGLHGASTELIARRAEITQAYIFRMFGTKKALFLELVISAFDRITEGMRQASGGKTGLDALAVMGAQYNEMLADRTSLLLQLQGFAACGDPEVRDAVRDSFGRMWQTVAEATGLDPVTVKTFLAFGMLLKGQDLPGLRHAAQQRRRATGRRVGRAMGDGCADSYSSWPVRSYHDRDEPVTATASRSEPRLLVPSLLFIALVVAAVGSLGAPLITSVATTFHVSLASAQWTLTITLLSGAIATPVLGRLGAGPHRRTTILVTLAVVAAGGALTVLPLPFAWLLVGRAAQGAGLGLTALMMGVARDHLSEERGPATIALVSVASTIGIGVGYPLAGLLTELGGVRAAYGLGACVTAVAFVAALRSMSAPPEGRSAEVDLPGALLLAAGLFLVLLLISENSLWKGHGGLALTLAAIAALLLCAWVAYERRARSSLIDVGLARRRAVVVANVVTLVGGIGMYLLLTLITRYAQTPRTTGYGFGLTTFVAGLVLVPFSLMGFIAGKFTPRLRQPIGAPISLAGSAIVVLGALAIFAVARSNVAELLAAMAILGFGVGSFSAAMPAVILAVTPKSETSSAMSLNQVVRSVGFSLGSAVGGLVLAAGTDTGRLFPNDAAYTTAAWIGAMAMVAAAITSVALARERAATAPH